MFHLEITSRTQHSLLSSSNSTPNSMTTPSQFYSSQRYALYLVNHHIADCPFTTIQHIADCPFSHYLKIVTSTRDNINKEAGWAWQVDSVDTKVQLTSLFLFFFNYHLTEQASVHLCLLPRVRRLLVTVHPAHHTHRHLEQSSSLSS